MTESRLVDMTLREFTDTCASSAPAPGGGSVAAAAGALAAALTAMVGNLTVGKKKYAGVEEKMAAMLGKATALQARFMQLVDDDTKAFNRVMAAFAMPKDSDDDKAARGKAIEDATYAASQTPMAMMRACAELMTQIDIAALDGKPQQRFRCRGGFGHGPGGGPGRIPEHHHQRFGPEGYRQGPCLADRSGKSSALRDRPRQHRVRRRYSGHHRVRSFHHDGSFAASGHPVSGAGQQGGHHGILRRHYFKCRHLGFTRLGVVFRDFALQDMQDIEKVAARLLYLGARIDYRKHATPPQIDDIKQMLQEDMAQKEASVHRINEGISMAMDLKDNGTRLLLERLLEVDEQQYDQLAIKLDLINRFGEAYLLEQG